MYTTKYYKKYNKILLYKWCFKFDKIINVRINIRIIITNKIERKNGQPFSLLFSETRNDIFTHK